MPFELPSWLNSPQSSILDAVQAGGAQGARLAQSALGAQELQERRAEAQARAQEAASQMAQREALAMLEREGQRAQLEQAAQQFASRNQIAQSEEARAAKQAAIQMAANQQLKQLIDSGIPFEQAVTKVPNLFYGNPQSLAGMSERIQSGKDLNQRLMDRIVSNESIASDRIASAEKIAADKIDSNEKMNQARVDAKMKEILARSGANEHDPGYLLYQKALQSVNTSDLPLVDKISKMHELEMEFNTKKMRDKRISQGSPKTSYIPGNIYKDKNGNRALYKEDGTWEEL